MSGRLRPHLAMLRWELRRLGTIGLVFAVPALVFALQIWYRAGRIELNIGEHAKLIRADAVGYILTIHLCFAALVALFLGSLSASSGTEEGNLDFLLVRNLGRTSIWLVSTCAGLLVLLGFLATVLPVILLVGIPEGEIFAYGFAGPLFGLLALYFTAAAVGGLTRRPGISIPISAVLLMLLGLSATLGTQSVLADSNGLLDWMIRGQYDLLLCGGLGLLGLLGALVTWGTVWLHRNPVQRRRLALGLGAGLVLLVCTGFGLMVDRMTLSPDEAVDRFLEAGEEGLQLGYDHSREIDLFRRRVAVPVLQARLRQAEPNSMDEALIQARLLYFGEPGCHGYFSQRLQARARKGGLLTLVDSWPLSRLDLTQLDRKTRNAIFELAERHIRQQAEPFRFDHTLVALCQATGLLDRPRALRLWIPYFRKLAGSGRWIKLQQVVRPFWESWFHDMGFRREIQQPVQINYGPDLPDDLVALLKERVKVVGDDEADWIVPILSATGRADVVKPLIENWKRQFRPGRRHYYPDWMGLFRGIDGYEVRLFALGRVEQLSADQTGAHPGELPAALLLLIERKDPRVLPYLLQRRPFRYDTFAQRVLKLHWPAAWRVLSENAPVGGTLNLIVRARLGEAAAARQLLLAQQDLQRGSVSYLVSLFGRAAGEDHRDVNLLLATAIHSRDRFLLDSLADLCHDEYEPTALLASVVLAEAGHSDGLAGLIDLLDQRPVHNSLVQSFATIRLAAFHLQRITGKRHGTDSRAWRAWFKARDH